MVMQSEFHVESIAQLIGTVRGNTKRNILGRKFDKIVYVRLERHPPSTRLRTPF